MNWNQTTIHNWGIDTFGPPALNTLGVAIRMCKESAELSNILMCSDDVDKISSEAADVLIVLYQVANCLSVDLEGAMSIESFAGMIDDMDKNIESELQISQVLNVTSIDLISCLFHGVGNPQATKHMIKIRAVLGFLEDLYPFNLLDSVQQKMEINAGRKWGKNEDGSYQHV